jgi:hypothetical protein
MYNVQHLTGWRNNAKWTDNGTRANALMICVFTIKMKIRLITPNTGWKVWRNLCTTTVSTETMVAREPMAAMAMERDLLRRCMVQRKHFSSGISRVYNALGQLHYLP